MTTNSTSNKYLILRLTGMTDHAYELAVFESAFQYLERTPFDESYRHALSANREFWNQWKAQWERRNQMVLHKFNFFDPLMVPSDLVRRAAIISFDKIHDPSQLNFLINRHVLRATFKQMSKRSGIKQSTLTHAEESTATH